MSDQQIYRLRAPVSGREAIAPVQAGVVYRDGETGEELEPVAEVLPLSPSESKLPRTPVNLRVCRRCEQLTGRDLATCEFCGLPAG
ncbi:MAG: hypothetical protein KDB62_01375 [Solirubrobacterales bacterium]|nr:hypothetical protein [Solirubrobacterales bacterium]